jgi:hypothetical protein
MIDLSKFVDKNVRVTKVNGEEVECKVLYRKENTIHPYSLDFLAYCRDGRYNNGVISDLDIIQIEEIKTMKKYEQLENQVAEMQKEIERLKREEKNYPNLKPVEVIRTVRFTPEEYFMCCEENGFEASEEGYVEYYSEPDGVEDCFMCRGHYTQEIKVVEN